MDFVSDFATEGASMCPAIRRVERNEGSSVFSDGFVSQWVKARLSDTHSFFFEDIEPSSKYFREAINWQGLFAKSIALWDAS